MTSIFDRWLEIESVTGAGGAFDVLRERGNGRDEVIPELVQIIRANYESTLRFAERARRLGYDRAADVIRMRLPTTATARSGDLGEILATEYVNMTLDFKVPINRLQWKDSRDMPLRGDDLIGFRLGSDGQLVALLKGESKSRAMLYNDALAEASTKLREYLGRPSPHSLMFIADRLHELGHAEWAEALEDYQLLKSQVPITHLLFTLSGNSPEERFSSIVAQEYLLNIQQRIVGIVVVEHPAFIDMLFELASA